MSLDLKQSSDSAVTTSWYGPGEERHLSVLCPAGWDVVAAGVVHSGGQSAVWWSGQVAGADGDKTVVELVEHLQPSSPASFLGRWAVEGIKHD